MSALLLGLLGSVGSALVSSLATWWTTRNNAAQRADVVKRQTEQVVQDHKDRVNRAVAAAETGDTKALNDIRLEVAE